ncbi:hypothetical protein AB3X28_11285 [Raoultella terrigena]|uniref:hypothetical protein n=1 Tax=Raoultella terrigena TaxID=577 RepID=UPI00349F3D02
MSKFKVLYLSFFVFFAGCSTQHYNSRGGESNVGTEWGEDVHSVVKGVHAERAYDSPNEVVTIKYANGLMAGHNRLYSIGSQGLEYSIRDANFNSLPIEREYSAESGRWEYVIPAPIGMTYQLFIRNHSSGTNYEVVATVDGLDVLTGQPGAFSNNGYILEAGKSLTIKGFRKNKQTEAAFQFSRVADSYAANSRFGDTNNAGVIGFAVFELKGKAISNLPSCSSQAFPAGTDGFAPAPCRR